MTSFPTQIGRLRQGSPVPLYLQLRQLLSDAIDARMLSEHDVIPAERDLAVEYDISRITVRQAIEGLVKEGRLIRRRGAGTFVAGRVGKSFAKISSFSEEMSARGRAASSQWVNRAAGIVTPEEALSLGLSPGAQVYRFCRVRFADDVPMAFEMSTIAGFCLPSATAVGDSLDAAGGRPVRALQRLRAAPFTGEHARMLGVDTGHAGLLIERRGFPRDGRAVEFTRSYYRGDAYDFVAELVDD